jgi:exonuclease VII small subunit
MSSGIAPGLAQTPANGPLLAGEIEQTEPPATTRAEAQFRYEIGQMERVLEGAVEHGAALTRDRLKAVLPPGDTLMSGENAHARGFRLDGYGVFFDIVVPPFDVTETTLAWSVRTLDQNDLGLESAMRELQTFVKKAGDANLQQALKRVELQVAPAALTRPAVDRGSSQAREATGSAASTDADTPPHPPDPILSDLNGAYRSEVVQALKDAMLDHSASLGIRPDDSLTFAARGNDDRPRLAPADINSKTAILRLRGADLMAYLARQISKDEALKRIEVRVF